MNQIQGTTTNRNKTVLITGSSQGLGLSAAQILAKKGANVVLVARTSSKLKQALQDVSKVAKNPGEIHDTLRRCLGRVFPSSFMVRVVVSFSMTIAEDAPQELRYMCTAILHVGTT